MRKPIKEEALDVPLEKDTWIGQTLIKKGVKSATAQICLRKTAELFCFKLDIKTVLVDWLPLLVDAG